MNVTHFFQYKTNNVNDLYTNVRKTCVARRISPRSRKDFDVLRRWLRYYGWVTTRAEREGITCRMQESPSTFPTLRRA